LLDGGPLAIERATGRTGVLSPEQILSRLDDRFVLLTAGGRTAPSRHCTLLATMDWSHDLLSGKEKILYHRLSVFSGGFTLEAVEAVCCGGEVREEEVLELLSHLLDKSLVAVEEWAESGVRRYRLLETIRQYAVRRLEKSGEAETLRRGHALFFLQFAEGSEPGLNGPERRLFLGRLEAEHDNLRAALGEIMGGDAGLRLAGALWFWFHRGYRDEGLGWLGAALGRAEPASAPARAKAPCGAGWLSFVQGAPEAGRSDLEKGVTVAREAGDDVSLA
jgi:predicted ATPase